MLSKPTPFLHLSLGDATYELRRCSWRLPWSAVAGVYAFVAWRARSVLYIGETRDFSNRMPGHEVWPDARARGANEVFAMSFYGSHDERRALERALIGAYRPPCNVLHMAAAADLPPEGVAFDPYDSFDAFIHQH